MFNAKQQARLDTLSLDAETSKKQVRDFVTGLVKSGSITEADATEVRRILSDKDMEAEDALDELRTLERLLAEEAAPVDAPVDAPANSDEQKPVESSDETKINDDDNEVEESAPAAPSMLAGLVSQITDPVIAAPVVAPKQQPEKTGKTIEPNRAEQNGLKRPSAGSTCALIWAACDRITEETGSTCTSGQLFTACNGLNECTLRTQYARWRQFNGITGRLPGQTKSQKVPAEFTEVLEQLAARLSSDDAKASLANVKNSDELVTWLAANFIKF